MKKILLALLVFVRINSDAQTRHYPLDGNANETVSGYNGVLGTGSNTPIATSDRFGNANSAMLFDGDDYINLPDTNGMNVPEFSISAWIYYDNLNSILRYWFCYGTFGTSDQACGLGPFIAGDGLFFAGYRTSNVYWLFTIGQPPTHQWYHVCGVYSLNYNKLYVNGILIDSSASAGEAPDYGTNPLGFIGSRNNSTGGWIGKIDDVNYFDYALSDVQVQALVLNESNVVTGNCFIDLNANGVKDVNENSATGIEVRSISSTGQTCFNFTDSLGHFQTLVDTGIVITTIQSGNYSSQPINLNSQHSSFGNIDSVTFALTPIPGITDAAVNLIPLNSTVPGFISSYNLVCYNNGTDTISGSIYLVIDQGMLYMGSNPTVDSISGDTLIWFFNGLNPLQSQVINLQLQVAPPPMINLGDTLSLIASIVTSGDVNNENDIALVNQIVIASHDPNDKTILEGNYLFPSQITNGDHLTYLIRFQNTGTASAHNVSVIDTLTAMLDWTTFHMIHASHPYSLRVINGNVLKWDFANIMLPDSNSNEPESQGYVCFSAKPLSTLIPGNIIENQAYIFFDFELPVITNTAQTTIIIPTSIDNSVTESSIYSYPNPVSDYVKIKGGFTGGKITIENSLGQKIHQSFFSDSETAIEVSNLKAGIYIVHYSDKNFNYTTKFLKQ